MGIGWAQWNEQGKTRSKINFKKTQNIIIKMVSNVLITFEIFGHQ